MLNIIYNYQYSNLSPPPSLPSPPPPSLPLPFSISLQLQLVLVMLKAHRHRARLICMGVRDLLEELQNKLDMVTPQDTEQSNLLAECWLQFNN